MKKTTKATKHRGTQTTTHHVTIATSPRPTDTLRPATSLEIMVSRALDQELDWWFSYGETAVHRNRVGMLPSYAAVQVTDPTDDAIRSRALDIARVVRGCLLTLPPRHAEVLRAVYTPRSWPKNVVAAFDSVSAIAVRLAFAEDPWPQRSGHSGLEQAAAMRLSAALASKSVSVPKLRNRAERMLGSAVVAYAGLRALESSTLGVR